MHKEVMQFFSEMRTKYPYYFKDVRVVEYGSADINGSVRELFEPYEYIGVDWRGVNGVDAVSLMHEYYDLPDCSVDVVVSTSTMEHDPHYENSLRRCHELLRPGGAMILCWVNDLWGEHCKNESPIEGYYKGLSLSEVVDVLSSLGMQISESSEEGPDCQVLAVRV